MKNFGKFISRQGRRENGEDERFTYYDNKEGVEWDIFFSKPENKANWYLAVDDEGRIGCCDRDAMQVRCSGLTVIGISDIAPWTNNEGGTIYGCRIDFENGAILPPPLPGYHQAANQTVSVAKRQKTENLSVRANRQNPR